MFRFPAKTSNQITMKTWVFISILIILPPIFNVLDKNDHYFHNVIWFFYLIATIITVFNKGAWYGIVITAVESILFLFTETLESAGVGTQEYITLAELLIVNVSISITLGTLFKEKNEKVTELNETKNLLESIFKNLEIAIWSDDLKNKQMISKGMEKIYGQKREDTENNPEFWRDAIHPEDSYISGKIEKKFELRQDFDFEYRIIQPSGEVRWIRDRAFPVLDDNGNLVRYDGSILDITNQKKLEAILKESEERYKNLVEKVGVGVYMLQDNNLVFVNQWFAQLIGISSRDLLRGVNFLHSIVDEDLQKVRMNFKKLIKAEESFFRDEIKINTLLGTAKDLELQAALTTVNGEPAIIGIAIDITDKKQAKAELERMAYHDSLTGLQNMNYLNQFIGKEFLQSHSAGIPVSMMYFNLDRFKLINDSYGHRIGDQLIKIISKRLVSIIHDAGTVIRAGGDDFIIYLPGTDQSQAGEFANLLMNVFSEPFHLDKQEIRIAGSIGIAVASPNDSLDDLVQKASAALHFAKEYGRNQYRYYSGEFREIADRRLILEQGMRKALDQGLIELYYQPMLDLHTNHVSSMEALTRWHDPILGTVPPQEFITLAEDTGLIMKLGKWALETACKQNREWQKEGLHSLNVCVNISSRQFLQDDFVSMVEQILFETGLEPKYLHLEITEGIALYSIEDTIRKLEKLKKLGVSISLDDFGTGYSSLSYIKSLPIDFLKIDRAFITGVAENKQDEEIIHSIISLSHSLGFKVVAEGVEDVDQLDALKRMNCDEIQGYYFARPMPANEFKQFLNRIEAKSC